MLARLSSTIVVTVAQIPVLTSASAFGQCDTVALHQGLAPPEGQGWFINPGSRPFDVRTGPVVDAGTEAWVVDDLSTESGSTLFYSVTPSQHQIDAGNDGGWTLAVDLRVPSDARRDVEGSPFAGYRDGETLWQMSFGLDANGDTIVRLITDLAGTGPVVTLPGNDEFRSFELRFDPVAQTADLFIDGVERFADYPGVPFDQKIILFGAGVSADAGRGHFARVQLTLQELPCRADLDCDFDLTIFDFLAFQNLFDSGDPVADFDGDGEFTIFDFLAFQNAFDAGCA